MLVITELLGSHILQTTGVIRATQCHNHEASDFAATDLKNTLKRKAAEEVGSTSNSEIFRRVTRHHQHGADVSFSSVERSMLRAKRRIQPRQPHTAEECANILESPEAQAFNGNLRSVITDQGSGHLAMIFYSLTLVPLMTTIKEWNFDGTFYTVPALFYQLFTLLGFYKGHSFPLIFTLMTSKSQKLYDLTMQKVKELIPNLNPEQAMGDFESSSGKAIRSCWPQIQIGGCQFHFSQNLYRKIQKLGLTELYNDNKQFNKWVKKIMTLSYVPANRMHEAVDSLFQENFDVNDHSQTKITAFKTYITEYWIRKVTPQRISVFEFSRGTNNDAESYHSRLKAIVRQHKPNIYTFLTHLNNLITDTTKDTERVDAGLDITRQKKEKFVRNIERRQNLKEQLQNRTYTLTQYINAVAYTFDSSVSAFQLPGDSGDESGDEHQGPDNNAAGTQDVPPELRCSICLRRRERTVVLLPCRHASSCADCITILVSAADNNNPATCPTCRTAIHDRLEVYI